MKYDESLETRVIQNLDFARANMKANIYDQAVLEGVATSFPQTKDIIENRTVNGMTATDIQKILNLKHAWEFILDRDVIQAKSDYYLLCHVAKLVNEGFFTDGGRIRGVPVTIGGCSYKPPIPIESIVKERIDEILYSGQNPIDIAIELCMYSMKTQAFLDGNKRPSRTAFCFIFRRAYSPALSANDVMPDISMLLNEKELIRSSIFAKKPSNTELLK